MKLRTKLPLAASTMLFAVVAAGLFGIFQMYTTVGVYTRIIEFDKANERLTANIALEFKSQIQEWKDVLLRGKDPQALEKYWRQFQDHEAKVATLTRKLQDSLPEGEARSLVEKFALAHTKMAQDYRSGFEAFKAAGFVSSAGDAAVKGMDREPAKLLVAAQEKIDEDAKAAVAVGGLSARR